MQRVELSAQTREPGKKGAARKVRAAGQVPAILYGLDSPPQACSLERHGFAKLLRDSGGAQLVVDLCIDSQAPSLVPVKHVDFHPVSGRIMHADFLRVDVRAIHAPVPVHLVGRPMGVETGGGILEQLTREVEVECLPTEIPSFFEVDVTALQIGDSLHVSDIHIPENVKCLTDGTHPLATVLAPRLVVEPTVSEEEEEGQEEAEGAEESTPEEE